jgi:homogentisate 1,2-dioxygenase
MYLILQLPWSILDFGGMEVRRPVIVTIPRGSNFKWHGEDRLPLAKGGKCEMREGKVVL